VRGRSSANFASTGVWEVLLAEAADDRLPLSRPGSRIPSGPAARIPPSWAAGLFRAPLRSRASRNGPKGAWTGPGPSETMRDRGGRADLGGGVGPSSCSRTVLLTTPVPCRRASSFRLTENSPSPKFADTEFYEVRIPYREPLSSVCGQPPIELSERRSAHAVDQHRGAYDEATDHPCFLDARLPQ
jgi:hypothetical protein